MPKCCCQRLGLYGGPTSTSIRVGTLKLCCLAMNTPLCLLFLKWESSVRQLRGLVLANYILECRTSSLLSKPRRDSSFMKLGSGGPISLPVLQRSSSFPMETFRTCNKCSCLFRPWAACQPNLQELGRVPIFTATTTTTIIITIDTGQQHTTKQQKQVRSTPPGLQKSKLPSSYHYSCTKAKENCTKRCALPGGSSIVIISRIGRKQHAMYHQLLFCSKAACNAKTSSQSTIKTTDHQLSQL